MNEFLEIGKIVATQGIKGEVRVQSFCDTLDVLADFDEVSLDSKGENFLTVERARVHKNVVVMKLSGYNKIEDVQKYIGKTLYAQREDFTLDDSSFFVTDILGIKVVNIDNGTVYGNIIDVTNAGASDVYHIKNDLGKIILIPAIADVVISTDVENKLMEIRPLKGLLDDED